MMCGPRPDKTRDRLVIWELYYLYDFFFSSYYIRVRGCRRRYRLGNTFLMFYFCDFESIDDQINVNTYAPVRVVPRSQRATEIIYYYL